MESITPMKRDALIIAMLVCYSAFARGPVTTDWGEVTNDARIALVLKGGNVTLKTNQPFTLTIRVQNLSSNQTLSIYRTGLVELDPRYAFRVLAPSGKDVSPVPPKEYSGSGVFVQIPPGQTRDFDFELRKICKFDEVGIYNVSARREIWGQKDGSGFIAESRRLQVTFDPGRWEGKDPAVDKPALHW
jgi:hypothetical protein